MFPIFTDIVQILDKHSNVKPEINGVVSTVKLLPSNHSVILAWDLKGPLQCGAVDIRDGTIPFPHKLVETLSFGS